MILEEKQDERKGDGEVEEEPVNEIIKEIGISGSGFLNFDITQSFLLQR